MLTLRELMERLHYLNLDADVAVSLRDADGRVHTLPITGLVYGTVGGVTLNVELPLKRKRVRKARVHGGQS